MINRDSPIPLYYQLKLHFKQQIQDGTLRAGDRLPTEMELCELFDISRAPVRQALAELVRDGLVYRRAGQGSFIAPLATKNIADKTKLRVLAHYDVRWMTSLEQATLNWNALHPEREVELDVTMCSHGEFHQLLRRMAIRGEAPDIAPMDYVWIAYYASEGYITPLEHLNARWAGDLSAEIEPIVLANNTYDGRLYGVPIQADITGLWYRRDIFEAEGLKPPEIWSEWLSLFDVLGAPEMMARHDYKYPLVLPVTSMTGEATVNLLISFIWMCGGNIVDAEGRVTLEADRAAICEAFGFLQQVTVARRRYLPKDMYRTNWWDLVRYFAQGQVPMALGGSYEWPRMREESDWEDEADAVKYLGFVLLPRPSVGIMPVGSLGGTSWGVFRQSAHQDLCAEVLRMMSKRDVSTDFCLENLQISPYIATNVSLCGPQHPWLSKIIPLLKHARQRPKVAGYLQLSNFLQGMIEHALWEGVEPEAAVRRTSQILSMVGARISG